MRAARTCPRCPRDVRPPSAWTSAWCCDEHGEVAPLAVHPGRIAVLDAVGVRARVPVWGPTPAPRGWALTGVAEAGDDRTGAVAVATAWSAPHPEGGPLDVLLVAEEPGTGLGARYAGLPHADPGTLPAHADAGTTVAGHLTPLWGVTGAPDRETVVGEALGLWLWVVLHPGGGSAVLETLLLGDLRMVPGRPVSCGAPTTLLGSPGSAPRPPA